MIFYKKNEDNEPLLPKWAISHNDMVKYVTGPKNWGLISW